MKKNPYLIEVERNLPRLLALFDIDRTSPSYGLGDRYHWAWGLIDFANGTFQGAAHGLARLWISGNWPYSTKKSIFLRRIDAIFQAVNKIVRSDGSLEEAFPNEGSYCVTALVAFDLLCALDLLMTTIEKNQSKKWEACIRPLIQFLIKSDETHALISNHLAAASAALTRWHRLTGEVLAEKKAYQLLERILSHQSAEGWFLEYEGADPGYQSLCTYYLADVHKIRPDWNLIDPLRKSIIFLSFFAHPDGSFGGLYGSRCTRFYCPAGILALADDIPEANALAKFMENSIIKQRTITLSSIDELNLIPMFNAYVWSALLWKNKLSSPKPQPIPAQSNNSFRSWLPESGILIDRGLTHYTVISTHKGGVVYHFIDGIRNLLDAGVVVSDRRGYLGSTQGFSIKNQVIINKGKLEICSQVTAMPKRLPNPFQFLVIRLLSLTVFKMPAFREWVKRRLVFLLITRKFFWPVRNHRRIEFGRKLTVEDNLSLTKGYKQEFLSGEFIPIHMASQGYWQIQDEVER